MISVSGKLTPQALTDTTTSLGPHIGSSTSFKTKVSGPPHDSLKIARIFAPRSYCSDLLLRHQPISRSAMPMQLAAQLLRLLRVPEDLMQCRPFPVPQFPA